MSVKLLSEIIARANKPSDPSAPRILVADRNALLLMLDMVTTERDALAAHIAATRAREAEEIAQFEAYEAAVDAEHAKLKERQEHAAAEEREARKFVRD